MFIGHINAFAAAIRSYIEELTTIIEDVEVILNTGDTNYDAYFTIPSFKVLDSGLRLVFRRTSTRGCCKS